VPEVGEPVIIPHRHEVRAEPACQADLPPQNSYKENKTMALSMVEQYEEEQRKLKERIEYSELRARNNPFKIVKISDRRYIIIERMSHALISHGVEDVETFKQIGKPLPYAEAMKELARHRNMTYAQRQAEKN
jgi:hypothetical protein